MTSQADERAEWRERIRSVGFVSRAASVREYRTGDGLVKELTDEAGNVTTFSNTGGAERVGVEIRPRSFTLPGGARVTHRDA